jgi:hypothetical protein
VRKAAQDTLQPLSIGPHLLQELVPGSYQDAEVVTI